jgi:hypothetical protein
MPLFGSLGSPALFQMTVDLLPDFRDLLGCQLLQTDKDVLCTARTNQFAIAQVTRQEPREPSQCLGDFAALGARRRFA